MRLLQALFASVFLLPFTIQVSAATTIITSPNDTREYDAITLRNGLQVMLVSDPSTDKAAAALDVAVGSADDPEAYQGLAHFLEHMLFLGTETFPEPGAYQRFISEHGGSHNAFTSLEHTNYFFGVAPEHLEAALARFSSQFISPLFNPEYVKREVNAVHSEFTSKLKDDGRRLFSVLKEIIPAEHPYAGFSVGNLESLKANDETALRDAMLDFYRQHYAAQNMKLVILGKETLGELRVLAERYFSPVSNFPITESEINVPLLAPERLPLRVDVQSVKDKRSLMLAFPIPSSFSHQQSKPVAYLANLIGHEGEGSLLASLKSRGLVNSLSAGSQFDTKQEELFTISMGLTEAGQGSIDSILKEVFAYTARLRAEGIKKRYFDEQSAMLKVGFAYQEKSEPIHFVSALANALHDYSAERVLYSGYDLSRFDAELYHEFLSHLRPDNLLLVTQFKSNTGDQTSPWYDAPYSVTPIDAGLIHTLKNVAPSARHRMPDPNPFIPDQMTLIAQQDQAIPERLFTREGLTLWHQTHTAFNTPKANLFVSLRSPVAMRSARDQNLSELLVAMFRDQLGSFSYPAYLAGLNYELYNHMRGATLKISGYSDKQSILMSRLLSTMKHGRLDAERFSINKDRLLRKLENASKAKPYEQAFGALQDHLLSPAYTEAERIDALANIRFSDMEEFRQEFLSALDVVVLSAGNVTRSASLNALTMIDAILLDDVSPQTVSRALVAKTHHKPAHYIELPVEHNDTGMVFYLQAPERGFEAQAASQLIAQIAGSDYYNELRTQKQLGYIVLGTYMPMMEVPGIVFAVQSPSADGNQLVSETLAFLSKLPDQLGAMDEAAFERNRAGLIAKLARQHKTLYQMSNFHWQEIDRQNQRFDSRSALIAAVEVMTQADLLAFVKRLSLSETENALVVVASKAPELTLQGWTRTSRETENGATFFSEF